MSTYPDLPGHRNVDTSIDAAASLTPKLGRLQRMAQSFIRDAGTNGLTADELAARLDMDRWSIQPRTSELKRKGAYPRQRAAQAECNRQAGHCLDRRMIAAAMLMTQSRVLHGGALKLHRGAAFGEVSIEAHRPESLEKPLIAETGTALALNYLTSGVAVPSACSTGRGGARNRADRESHALTAAQIANLKAAERHADKIGLPFTRMISIHWQAAGVPLAGMAKATGRLTDLLAKAMVRHSSATAWLWTHENVPGKGHDKGGHFHLLAHVPAALVPVLTGLQRGWLRRITGQPYSAGVIYSKPIGGRLGLETGNPDLHAANLQVAFGYLCKGAPQAILDRFEIEQAHQPSGRVIGKRCGTSQNIGQKARQTWQSKNERLDAHKG